MEIEYSLRVNRRARRMILTVQPDGRVLVTTPRKVGAIGRTRVERFIQEKTSWIIQTQARFADRSQQEGRRVPKPTASELVVLKARALQLATERLEYFNASYFGSRLKYQRISIRDQKTRWGSCSRQGNLAFNYRIAFLPPRLVDYLVVHELCHLREMNHSPAFWALVAGVLPDWRQRRSELKKSVVQTGS